LPFPGDVSLKSIRDYCVNASLNIGKSTLGDGLVDAVMIDYQD